MNKLKRGIQKIKWPLYDLFYKVGIKSLSAKSQERRILVYHGIVADARTDINARFISTALFEQQLQFFSTHFHLVSIEDYFKGASHPNKLTLAITFDDGYLNNYTETLPLLTKYKIPATFFITTIRQANYAYLWADLIDLYRHTGPDQFKFNNISFTKKKHEYISLEGSLKSLLKAGDWSIKKNICDFILNDNIFIQNEALAPYFQLMNEEQILKLSKSPYASIGSHGLYHNCLTKVSIKEVEFELKSSKAYLENIIQKEVNSFAYPDGDYNIDLVNSAEKIGYTSQLLVNYNSNSEETDPRTAERFGINPYISFNNQIQSIINGCY